MKTLLLALPAVIAGIVAYAQQMPIDFSGSEDSFTGFEGTSFTLTSDPEDAGNQVGQFFNDGATSIQGFFIDLTQPIDLEIEKTVSLDFYSFDPNEHTITLKLELGSSPDVEVTQTITGQGWTRDVVFDFASATQTADASTVNASGTYSRVTLFIDIDTPTSGTFLIDDINDGTVVVDPEPEVFDVIYDYLVWSDEFDSDGEVDDTKWFHQTQLPAGGNWFNGEEQHYTSRTENSYVEGGYLYIVAKRENFTDQGETKAFTSARLNSKYAFTYGRVDVRARLPEGDGTWPAIWTLGKNINEAGAYWQTQGFGTTSWPSCGEIDIMEHGLGVVNHVSSAIHTPSSFGNTINTASIEISDVATNFHIYSVNWSPDQITFLVDGVVYYTYDPAFKISNTWPFNADQYLLLNVAMGGIAGTIDPNFVESPMVIDYVRVYQTAPDSPDNPDEPDEPVEPDPLSEADTQDSSIKIYPNPASGYVTLIKEEGLIERLVLFNASGQEVLRSDIRRPRHLIDLSPFPAGMYLLNLYTDSGKSLHKLVID